MAAQMQFTRFDAATNWQSSVGWRSETAVALPENFRIGLQFGYQTTHEIFDIIGGTGKLAVALLPLAIIAGCTFAKLPGNASSEVLAAAGAVRLHRDAQRIDLGAIGELNSGRNKLAPATATGRSFSAGVQPVGCAIWRAVAVDETSTNGSTLGNNRWDSCEFIQFINICF
ncbi:MAG: hypothetical protein KDH98_11175 [Calditrichaeota bacterium]|nr:hypothetical protein [Calditrichota bacterium]